MRRSARSIAVLVVTASLGVAAWPGAQAAPPRPAEPGAPVAAADPTSSPAADRGTLPPAPAAAAGDAAPPASSVLVRFDPAAGAGGRASTLRAEGLTAAGSVGGTGFVEVPVGDADPAEVAAALQEDPAVLEVQVDHVRSAERWTDDPLLEYAWPYLDLLRLPRAWDVTAGSGQVVAVLDTGVSATHEDLRGRLVAGYDVVNGDADPSDDQWHGTAVAGVAAGTGDNGLGGVGAAYAAKVMPVKVLDADGNGYDSDVADGIAWATAHGADVINLSLGGPDPSPVLRAAVQAAIAQGVVVVASSGNEGTRAPNYPAAYAPELAGLLSVGATDDSGYVTEFSSWGDTVSVTAPGFQIVAPDSRGGYLAASGTSFAAPLVSGIAALLTSRNLDPARVEQAIVSTARDSGPRGRDPYYGAGVVDAAAALGLGVSVPRDLAAGDGGADDTAARAVPLATTTTAALVPEGDEDWYSVAAQPGWYSVTVTPSASTAPITWPRVTVVGADGELLATAQAGAEGQTLTLPVPVATAQAIRVGVANVDAAWGDEYRVDVRRSGSVLFTRNEHALDVGIGDRLITAAALVGDAPVDVAVARVGSSTVRVDPGAGDGTFQQGSDVPLGGLGGTVTGLVALDAEGDGDADLVVTTTTGYVLLRQDGGQLAADAPVTVTGGVSAVLATDLDGDGDPDLVTAEGSPAATVTHRNPGTGAFGAAEPVGAVSAAVRAGDLDRDGRPDLLSEKGEVLLQRADGTFAPGATVAGPWSTIGDVELGDVTGDGIVDVVRAVPTPEGEVHVLPGRGDGTFGAAVVAVARPNVEALALADVTGDGRLDVVAASGGWNALSVLAQRQDGTLDAWSPTWVGHASHYLGEPLAVQDVTGDGTPDVLLSGSNAPLDVLVQRPLAGTGTAAWVLDASVRPHQSGVDGRPTLTATTGRALATGAVSDTTVRLVDAVSGTAVPATRGYDAATGLVSVRPSSDLVPGRHYRFVVRGLTDADGAVQTEPFEVPFTAGADGERFTPVEPQRALDTRQSLGAQGPVRPGSPITVSFGGLSVPQDASAVVLNVTAVNPSSIGNVRVYPTPAGGAGTPPTVSNLNVVPGADQPNMVTVALGAGGNVSLATDGTTAHLLADVAGYYRTGGATAYVPVDPVRVMDTRNGTGGVPAAQVRSGRWVDLQVRGRNGVPADASAVVLNVTGVQPSGKTNVRVYPTPVPADDMFPPTVSNLNLYAGRDQPNLVTVAVGEGGKVRFYTQTASLHLVADLAGYYSPTGDRGYVPLTPTRIADSRSGLGLTGGALQPGVPATLAVAGAGGVPADAEAAVLNVTAVRPDRLSNLRVYPASASGAVPLVSNLNVVAGRDEPNLVIARLGQGGRVSLYSQTARVGVVVDVAGYFRR